MGAVTTCPGSSSGTTRVLADRFHEYFVEHQRVFYKKLKDAKADPNKLPFRPLFLAKPTHGQFVLLAFYSHEDDQLRQFLAKNLGFLILSQCIS